YFLGCLAAMLERWPDAERHFEDAVAANRVLGAMPSVARARYAHALALRARAWPGDAERACALLREARDAAETLGMERRAARVARALATDGRGCGAEASSVFRREGEFWTIAFEGSTLSVRDTRGIRYLAQLLRQPGREVFAADLVAGGRACAAPSANVSTGLEVLDARAVGEYRGRLADLRDALAEAEAARERVRGAAPESEIDSLARQLASSLGLGNRRRQTGSVAERARVNVRKGIEAALRKILAGSPALGRHLVATVRTGTF